MEASQRFSLLLLEDGEYYFEDFSCFLYPKPDDTRAKSKKMKGRLKLCSKSLVFDPEDADYPVLRIQLSKIRSIEKHQGVVKQSVTTAKGIDVFAMWTDMTIEMLENGIVGPYTFNKTRAEYRLSLNYVSLEEFLSRVGVFLEISRLNGRDQESRLAELIAQREAAFQFDPTWIEDISERREMECTGSRVTPLVHNPGRVLITTEILYFQPFNNISHRPVEKWPRSRIIRVIRRRHTLRHTGLEVFFNDNTSVFFSFKSMSTRDDAFRLLLASALANDASYQEEQNMTLRWQHGRVSNFDYLMWLNSQADRTFNDLTQYPVFPWIIADYSSPTLDLLNPASFRDLSKPIGALNAERLSTYKKRFQEMPAGTGPDSPFLYGTHYSTPGYVLYFLIRNSPELMLRLQSGRFDSPDRMFDSVADTWGSVLTNPGDVKELIPEFYGHGSANFMLNSRRLDLGTKQNGRKVNDVTLPPWAKNPEDFVRQCRLALECDYVSARLHTWIDLIFGYKQRGDEAVKADNLFYYLTYEGAIDMETIADPMQRAAMEIQIREFGQTPKQLFTLPHPQRQIEGAGVDALTVPVATLALVDEIPASVTPKKKDLPGGWVNLTSLECVENTRLHKESINALALSADGTMLYTVSNDATLKVYSVSESRQLRSVSIAGITLSSCALAPDGKTIYIGAWDHSIYCYSLEYGRVTSTLVGHDDAVGALCVFNSQLFSGSWDSTIKVWELRRTNAVAIADMMHHESEIRCLDINLSGTMAVSGGADGLLVLWDLGSRSVVRSIEAHTGDLHCARFTPNGQSILTCGADRSLHVFDIGGGEVLVIQAGEELRDVFSDGRTVLAVGESGRLRMWELSTGAEINYQLTGAEAGRSPVTCMGVSADGRVVVVGCKDGTYQYYRPYVEPTIIAP